MKKSKFDVIYDVRVIERNIRQGVIDKGDYENYLNSLEDQEENAVPITIEEEGEGGAEEEEEPEREEGKEE